MIVSDTLFWKLALVTAMERFIKDDTFGKHRIKILIIANKQPPSHWTYYLTERLLKIPEYLSIGSQFIIHNNCPT